jgi:pyrroline-5-carboxylate reductase
MEKLTIEKVNLLEKKIFSFGHGSMGGAIINFLLENGSIDKSKYKTIVKSSKSREKLTQKGINVSNQRIPENIENADIIFLFYKPDSIEEEIVYENFSGIVISILAGVKIKNIQEKFPNAKIVRAMPNRGSVVGEGCTFLQFFQNFPVDEKKPVTEIFAQSGDVYEIFTTKQMDQATILSASMVGIIAFFQNKIRNTLNISERDPKFRNFFIKFNEIVENLAKKYRFLPEQAAKIAKKTFHGVSELSHQQKELSKNKYACIQKSVTSPNGTTQAMIEYLEKIEIENFLEEIFSVEANFKKEKQKKFEEVLENTYLVGIKRAKEMAKGKSMRNTRK